VGDVTFDQEVVALLGVSRQPSRFMKVDLPDPEGPMMATNSPGSTFRSTPLSAGKGPAAVL
jgi:hypothetical protein